MIIPSGHSARIGSSQAWPAALRGTAFFLASVLCSTSLLAIAALTFSRASGVIICASLSNNCCACSITQQNSINLNPIFINQNKIQSIYATFSKRIKPGPDIAARRSIRRVQGRAQRGRRLEERGFARRGRRRRAQRSEWLRVAEGERERGSRRRRRRGLNRRTAIAKLRRKTVVSSWIATITVQWERKGGFGNQRLKAVFGFDRVLFVWGCAIFIDLIPWLSSGFLVGPPQHGKSERCC